VYGLLIFKGVQKTTLIDFPGKVAATLFLPKCNFRCPFCYNAQLVLNKETGAKITEKEALSFLRDRRKFLDGVCITGGEPMLHAGLPAFCKKAKRLGLLVKIDTNGSKPEMLQKLIAAKAVDYIAMDIKATKEKYGKAAGTGVDLQKIQRSIDLIKKSGIEYEFRITVVPALHSRDDLIAIGEWLQGAKQFFLQQFDSSVPLLDKKMQGSRAYSKEELLQFALELRPFFEHVAVRGI
jgi:pyruvate formate lyase activating enzyme